MAKSSPSDTYANDGSISINRNLFISLLILVGFLFGICVGFFIGQYNATQQFDAITITIPTTAPVAQQPAVVVDEISPTEIVATEIPQQQEISVDDDPYLGPEDAPITIVEFSDYQCGYCARFHEQTLQALMEKYPDQVRFVYRDFPLPSHTEAQKAAEAAQCANDQGKFWEMQALLFSDQSLLSIEQYKAYAVELGLETATFNQCLESGKYEEEVYADLMEGAGYGVSGTPVFFVNGTMIKGAVPLNQFDAIIQEELSKITQ